MAHAVPFLINVRDRFTTTRNLTLWALAVPGAAVHLVDNDSTYPPLLAWYGSLPAGVTLHRLGVNAGPQAIWRVLPRVAGGSPWYATADCDMDMAGVPPDLVARAAGVLEARPDVRKVGPALRVDDLPDTTMGRVTRETEADYWRRPASVNGLECYDANIDVNFYVSRVATPFCYGPALRIAGAYQCRHAPCYYTRENLPEDERWYLERANMHGLYYSPRLLGEVRKRK